MNNEQQSLVVIAPQIEEYKDTAAVLQELRDKYENVVFPVETTKGMKDAKEVRKNLRELRVGLEKMRVEIKEPALRRCQLIDSEAKEITAQLRALEEPIDKQIKLEEDRKEREKAEKERKERERVEAIRAKIDAIQRLPIDSANDKAVEIELTIKDLEGLELIAEEYAEFLEEAFTVKKTALEALRDLLIKVKVREEELAKLAADRAELERLKAEAAERERKLQEEREAIAKERAELEAMKQQAAGGAALGASPVLAAKAPAEAVKNEAATAAMEALTHKNGAPMFSSTTFKENGDPIMLDANGNRSIFCDVDEVEAEHPQEPATVSFDDAKPGDTISFELDANSVTRELANYTALQFFAMARKVRAVGNEVFAGELETVANNVQSGHFDEFIKNGDWLEMANADKEMALASHACVSIICGDEELGPSALLAAAE